MKKYVVPIAGRDIDLSRIKFSEPLSCEIDNNKINITYKKHLDSNTYNSCYFDSFMCLLYSFIRFCKSLGCYGRNFDIFVCIHQLSK